MKNQKYMLVRIRRFMITRNRHSDVPGSVELIYMRGIKIFIDVLKTYGHLYRSGIPIKSVFSKAEKTKKTR